MQAILNFLHQFNCYQEFKSEPDIRSFYADYVNNKTAICECQIHFESTNLTNIISKKYHQNYDFERIEKDHLYGMLIVKFHYFRLWFKSYFTYYWTYLSQHCHPEFEEKKNIFWNFLKQFKLNLSENADQFRCYFMSLQLWFQSGQ